MRQLFLPLLLLRGLSVVGALIHASGALPATVHFTDITDASGITFRHTSAPEKQYIVESMGGGVALFDYDNDGCLDIYFTNSLTVDTANDPHSARSALYRGHCDGTFTDVTEKSGLAHPGWVMGVTVADYDGDGYEDLYVTCRGGSYLSSNDPRLHFGLEKRTRVDLIQIYWPDGAVDALRDFAQPPAAKAPNPGP